MKGRRLPCRDGRRSEPAGLAIVGSPDVGYRSETGRFYTWQPERSEVVAWVAELPLSARPPRRRRRRH